MYTQSKHESAVSNKLKSFRSSFLQSTVTDKMLPIQISRINEQLVISLQKI